MDNTKPLAVMPTDYSPAHWQAMKEMSKEFHAAGALPAHWNSAARILIGLQAGAEMGIPPIQALSTLYIVNGKIAMEGIAMLKKLRQGEVKVEWVKSTDTECTVKLTRPDDQSVHEETFTIEDAKRAGLAGKDTWTKYPKDQLRWKALSRAARFHAPDIVQGAYIVDDLADMGGSGIRHNEQGGIVIDVVNPIAEAILADIAACTDRKTYIAEILPKIKDVKTLSYSERATITKAAELKLEEFAKAETEVKAKKRAQEGVVATKAALDQGADEQEEEPTEAAEELQEEAGEKTASMEEVSEEEMAVIVKKIRGMTKQTPLVDYIQSKVNPMPLDKEQKAEVRKWVGNKIAQLNGAVPDPEDLKTIFGY